MTSKMSYFTEIFLENKFHYLLKPSNPVTDDLLGPNLEQQISEGNRVMEAAKRLAITCKPYFKSNFKRDKYKSK